MLTSTQCRVVAYTAEGGIYCPDCAAKVFGIIDHRTALGYRLTGLEPDLSALIAYELDSYESELAGQYEAEGYSETEAADLAETHCEECADRVELA